MLSDITFDKYLDKCPACQSNNVEHEFFQSTAGFMSLPGVRHDKCRDCGTVFVNPQPSKKELDKFYTNHKTEADVEDNIIQSSLSRYFDSEKRHYFLSHRVEPITRYIQPPSSLIDIGCGTGVFVRFMKDKGFRVKGIDLSKKSIEFGQNQLNLNEISVGGWEEISATATYDAITAWTVIEHLPDPEAFLQKCNVVLKPEGILLLEFPTVDSLLYRMLQSSFFWVMPPYHLVLFSRSGISHLLHKTGFQVIEAYPMPKNWYFSNSVARRCGVDIDQLLHTYPEAGVLFREIDSIFDLIALELKETSSIQLICRKVTNL